MNETKCKTRRLAVFIRKLFVSFLFLLFFNVLLGFRVNNQMPFFQIFGVPSPESPEIVSNKVQFLFDVAHHCSYYNQGSSILYIRGETYTFNFAYDRKLGENWQVGIELPYVLQRSTNLQDVIDEYHYLLGLGRVGAKKGDNPGFYLYVPGVYSSLNYKTEAFGDLLLKLKRSVYSSKRLSGSVFAYWKLPTGKRSAFTGSGNHDYSLAFSLAHLGDKFGFDTFWSYSYLGECAPFSQYQKTNLYTANWGLDYFFSPRWTLRAQLNGSSSYYKNTKFSVLDDGSFQLFTGVIYKKNSWEWQFFLGEDVWVSHSPDVSFSFVGAYAF